jgi:peptidoglycan/LPS O-acetylase OafA/YrhL
MQTERLTTSESVMLDIIRVIAAAVVAYGHLTQLFFSTGWQIRTSAARDSVAVFFILSGFVIRHVTIRRPETIQRYLIDRASRIYSIAIPALLLTWIGDSIALHVNPTYYASFVGDYHYPLARILVNLAFCGQLWNYGINPLSNSPYWSINYEVAYYIGYALLFYLRGKKQFFSFLVLCLIVGPRILFLAPLWIAGCIIHDLYQKWNTEGTTARNLNRIILACLIFVAILSIPAVRYELHALSYRGPFPHIKNFLATNHLVAEYMKSKRLSNMNYLFGIVWALVFMKLLQLSRHFTIKPDGRFVRAVRFISEGTYPIYLLHYPLFVLIAACIPYNHASSWQKLVILISVLIIGVLAGHPGNILKLRIRSALTR